MPAASSVSWGFFAYTRDFVEGLNNARWGRATEILWAEVERQPGSGQYSWGDIDNRVQNLQAARISLVLVLKTGNGPSFSEASCFSAVDAAAAAGALPTGRESASCPLRASMETAWSRMVTELVERYDGDGQRDMPGLGGVRVDIELENEAANPQLWDYGEADRAVAADHYLRLLDLTYQAKQAANPATQVILTGIHQLNLLASCDSRPANPNCTSYIMDNIAFTKRILTRPEIFDAVDLHFFCYYHFEPTFIDAGLGWVVDQMQRRGYQRPIYGLEWTGSSMLYITQQGHTDEFLDYFPYRATFPNEDALLTMYVALDAPENLAYRHWFEAEQAKEFGKVFTNMLALGVRRLVHVQYSDHRDGAWDNAWWNWQGVIKYMGGAAIRKPSYYTYNILSERIVGFTAARRIEQGNGVRLYEFTFATGDPTYVLWTDGASGLLDLSRVTPRKDLRLTPIVTELGAGNQPIVPPEQTVPATAVPVNDVPVLLRGVG